MTVSFFMHWACPGKLSVWLAPRVCPNQLFSMCSLNQVKSKLLLWKGELRYLSFRKPGCRITLVAAIPPALLSYSALALSTTPGASGDPETTQRSWFRDRSTHRNEFYILFLQFQRFIQSKVTFAEFSPAKKFTSSLSAILPSPWLPEPLLAVFLQCVSLHLPSTLHFELHFL